jgi:hypothetical protein
MSEQGNFDTRGNFRPADAAVTYLNYPDMTAIRVVAEDPKVAQGLEAQADSLLTPADRLNMAGDLKKFIVSKHRLSMADARIALLAYQETSSETRELAKTQHLEHGSDALARLAKYICGGGEVIPPANRTSIKMKRMAHAN